MMVKPAKDKIISILASGLLGYYLAKSLLRGMIWNGLLLRVLPPLNYRHLPTAYVGVLGAVVGILLAYLLYTALVEKKPWAAFKGQYLLAFGLLLIAPLMVIGAFRWHAISLVQRVESTVPTGMRIEFHEPADQIMFATSSRSAVGIVKTIALDESRLAEAGEAIRDLELKEVVPPKGQLLEPQLTLWIDYEVGGKWYSKILAYGEGIFQEGVSGNRFAWYTGSQLAQLLATEREKASRIDYYQEARIMNSQTVNGERMEVPLTPEQWARIKEAMQRAGSYEPSSQVKMRFQSLLAGPVAKNEQNVYAICLIRKTHGGGESRNFMVYDGLTRTLMFEGNFYSVDLENLWGEMGLD